MQPKDEMRAKIKSAVIECMETTDIPSIRVSTIVQSIGIARSTFYRYYDSVDDVVKEIEAGIFSSVKDINDLALFQLRQGVDEEMIPLNYERSRRLGAHAREVKALCGPHGDPQYTYKAKKTIREYLERKFAAVPNSPSKDFALEFLTVGMQHMVDYWMLDRDDLDSDAFTHAVYDSMALIRKVFKEEPQT